MRKLARISFNSRGWRQPTGEARDLEAPGTYNQINGFGHEDWFFRSEWTIDGWRYAFLQGVNNASPKVRAGGPLDVTLFTFQPDKRWRYVASVSGVECLSDWQADEALRAFKRLGWFHQMLEEVRSVSGNESALGAAEWAKHVLNVRFRQANVKRFAHDAFVEEGDPLLNCWRYKLYNDYGAIGEGDDFGRALVGSSELPVPKRTFRRAVAETECTPEHTQMQARLMTELRSEYPNAVVLREANFVDVCVRTPDEIILFEIKSDLQPRAVIRQALGQLVEYAYHPTRTYDRPVRLVIVGRASLSPPEQAYMQRLQNEFNLPVEYRALSLT